MTIELEVKGMTCGHCEKAVKNALEGIAGVTVTEVNRITNTARIEGQNLSLEPLLAAIVEEGYSAALRV